MTATQILYRKANVSEAQATASLFKRFPAMTLVGFEKKEATAEEAKAARANEGDAIYAATIRVAEFPPKGEEESGEAEAPKEEAPKEDSSPSDDSDTDDAGGGEEPSDDGGSDEFGAKDEHHGIEPKKLSPDEQIIHLLQQLVDAVKGGHMGMGDDMGPGGPGAGLDLPDVGAPDKGDMMPGGPEGLGGLGGPGGPMGGKPPLPPPVKEKSPIGAGAFASVTGHSEVTMVREDASQVNNKTIITEAGTYVPTHRVAKIQRTGLAQVGDDLLDLAEAGVALVTLVSR